MTETICVRWTFNPERAKEFLEPIIVNGVTSQPIVSQVEYDSIEDVMEELNAWSDAVTDASALINGQVISLSDHPGEVEEAEDEV